MSYVKNNWKNGDVISADKLNHMEDGISSGGGGGALIVGQTVGEVIEDPGGDYRVATLNKTWAEISEAMQAGTPCMLVADDVTHVGKKFCAFINGAFYNPSWYDDTPYILNAPTVNDGVILCATADGYPTYRIFTTTY